MKTTLIYVAITECGFDSFGKNLEGSWISHGLSQLSACAKEKGFNVNLIDFRTLKGWNHFREKIKEDRPDVVGLTMMSVDYNNVIKCAKMIREALPQTKIVVGGPHPTILPEEVENIKEFDHVILKEAEISFVELLEKIRAGKESERIITGRMPDLNEIPFADRELFPQHEKSICPEKLPEPFVTIIAGRGCMYNCSFCQPAERKIFGPKVRRRNVENVIAELKILRERYNFKSFFIHDDCLTEDKEWVLEFCKRYKEEGFTQQFGCQSRTDIICRNDDMVKALKDAGLALFFLGFESGNQRILNFMRKGTTVEQNLKAAEICHDNEIKIWANYMLGLPTETKEEAIDTINMVKKIKPYHCSPAFYTPHPGSDMFDYCEEHDLNIMKGHESYRRNIYAGPKIKGIDYKFLEKIAWESIMVAEDTQAQIKAGEGSKKKRLATQRYLLRRAIEVVKKEGVRSLIKKSARFAKRRFLI